MKKGFTLVELLAVITVLAIILVIAIPNIQRLINENKKDTFLINAKSIIKQIKYEDKNFLTTQLSELNLEGIAKDGYDADLSTAYISDEEIYLNLVGTGQYKGMYLCNVNLTTNKSEVQNTPCEELEIYIVTFDPNGGSVAISSKEVIYNSTYGSLPIPKREGYKFLGWNGKNILEPNENYALSFNNSRNNYSIVTLNNGIYTTNANLNTVIYGYEIRPIVKDNVNYVLSAEIVKNSNDGGSRIGYDADLNGTRQIKRSIFHVNVGERVHYNVKLSNTISSCIAGLSNTGRTTGLQFKNLMLEEGNTATEYEPYYVTKDIKVTQRKNHTLKAIWKEV